MIGAVRTCISLTLAICVLAWATHSHLLPLVEAFGQAMSSYHAARDMRSW